MTATTTADQRRILDIATRAVRDGKSPADVAADPRERDFMRAHSWSIWTAISELRSGKPTTPTQTTASPSAKRTTITVDSDRTVVEVVDDDPEPQYAKPGDDGDDDDGEPCDPTDPTDDDCDVDDDD